MSWFHALRARARLLSERDAEARMLEEIALHVDMEAARLQREEGLDAAEARRRANIAFGPAEAHKDELRDGRGLAWLGGLKLDLKLGARMLAKYPGLTIVGGLAMAFGIWVGAVSFVMVGQVVDPKLPLPDGERVVRIVNWDVAAYEEESRSLSDFLLWREALRTVTDLGAYSDVTHNLIVDGDAQPLRVASITSSAFDVAPIAPLHGRVLEPADERADAPPVVLLSYDVWRERFASDPGVVGRMVQLDDTHATVVGIMPEDFGFPVSQEAWTPLRHAASVAPRSGIPIEIFGRLAPGATLEGAQAELTQLGERMAVEHPSTHEHLEPHVISYTGFFPESVGGAWIMAMVRAFAVLLLVLMCSNVALLMFARAAAREGEIVVRSALGASRSRILVQLFAEALVLGAVAAVAGLFAAQVALRVWGVEFFEQNYGPLPFWFDVSLSPAAVLYAILLTVLGAAIAGLLPARRITRGLGASLRQGSAGGGGARFGGVWTAVIVTQVAVTVAFPAIVFAIMGEYRRIESYDAGFASDQYLGVTLDMDVDPDSAGSFGRFASSLEALRARLLAEPGVAGVAYVSALPRDYHRSDFVELDGATTPDSDAHEVALAYIDPRYFQVLAAPVLGGRSFTPADQTEDPRVVIVDEEFVARVLGGQNAVGRRVRFAADDGTAANDSSPWLEVVGVVERLGMEHSANRDRGAGVYMPIALDRHADVELVVHAPGDPLALATRVRQLAVGVDPMLRVANVQRLDQVTDGMLWMIRLWRNIAYALTAVALLLSLAGIYAVMSFTVVRRTREIGVRVALGGTPRRILASIFRRPFTQVATGIAIGFVLVTAAAYQLAGARPDGRPRVEAEALTLGDVGLIAAYAALMLGVCLLACVVPTMRVLRVQPTEALRTE